MSAEAGAGSGAGTNKKRCRPSPPDPAFPPPDFNADVAAFSYAELCTAVRVLTAVADLPDVFQWRSLKPLRTALLPVCELQSSKVQYAPRSIAFSQATARWPSRLHALLMLSCCSVIADVQGHVRGSFQGRQGQVPRRASPQGIGAGWDSDGMLVVIRVTCASACVFGLKCL